ncbi:MAG TPA: SDR family oxidoreductase [Acidobacteriota bacterium]|nr:SDR family oxidoreductase [Acidobacteriota bacterium]
MRVAVTGAAGLLGWSLVRVLSERGHTVVAGVHRRSLAGSGDLTVCALDLTDDDSIGRFVEAVSADCLIHAAAMTHVDRCETEPALAERLNAIATTRLVDAVDDSDTRIVYVSTDFVFDGEGGPYVEDDPVHPLNVYGRTKLAGEEAVRRADDRHAIVRAAGFLGVGDPEHPTFVETMLASMKANPPLCAAGDQRSNITPVGYLAAALVEIAERALGGTWHVAGREVVSRYELARRLAVLWHLPESSVQDMPYAALDRPARRPLNGGLCVDKAAARLRVTAPSLDESLATWKCELDAAGGLSVE